MSGRTLAILFVVLLLVGGAAYFTSQQEPEVAIDPVPTSAPRPETVTLVEEVILEQVARLELRRTEDTAYASFLHEPSGAWFQTQPTQTALISTTMDTPVSTLINLASRRTLGADDNPLSAYGLDAPQYEITLAVRQEETEGTALFKFIVGDETSTGNAYYVQKEGDPRVHLIAKFTIDNLLDLIDSPPILPSPPPLSDTETISNTNPISDTNTITNTIPITDTDE